MEFKVGTAISRITVTAYCKTFSKSQNKEILLESSSEKTLPPANKSSPVNVYLKETDDGYNLYVLGKNGEPKVTTLIELNDQKYILVRVTASYLLASGGMPNDIQKTLQSDQNGVIKLGKMPNVSKVHFDIPLNPRFYVLLN